MRKTSALSLVLTVMLSVSVQAAELREQFSFGINYAWQHFANDFGGNDVWAKRGVAEDPDSYARELNEMAEHGVKVVRWWVWPELWTSAITFDGNGVPQPLGQQAIDDGLKALELAANANIRIMFCLWSFDGFRPSRDVVGIQATGYRDIVIDDQRRRGLMENVVRPFAEALQASPHRDALHSWDVINEPEWAVTGADKYGGQDFDPNSELEHVTHDQMEVFLADTISVLRDETPDIPLSIGSAAIKWAPAWRHLDVDFYQIHIYDWVNAYWPYTQSPSDLGMGDKPMIMGEYPVEGLSNATHEQMLSSWFNNGYAGALGWDYRVTHSPGLGPDALAGKRLGYLRELEDFATTRIPQGSSTPAIITDSGNGGVTTPPTSSGEPEIGAAVAPLSVPGQPTARIIEEIPAAAPAPETAPAPAPEQPTVSSSVDER